jgi:hypothetical protein
MASVPPCHWDPTIFLILLFQILYWHPWVPSDHGNALNIKPLDSATDQTIINLPTSLHYKSHFRFIQLKFDKENGSKVCWPSLRLAPKAQYPWTPLHVQLHVVNYHSRLSRVTYVAWVASTLPLESSPSIGETACPHGLLERGAGREEQGFQSYKDSV